MSETYKLNQWAVTVDGAQRPLITPGNCDTETAMAIAVETFGAAVTAVVDEGIVKRTLTHQQMHIADRRWCEGCGEWLTKNGDGHDSYCPLC